MGVMINSSAQILPRCLSFEFASSANVAYCMQFVNKLHEKNIFRDFQIPANIFLGVMINSSAQILPRCLSFEFASSANVAYCMQFVNKLHEKNIFRDFQIPANIFLGVMINSSAQILPRCLSFEFASSANVVLWENKDEKIYFDNCNCFLCCVILRCARYYTKYNKYSNEKYA